MLDILVQACQVIAYNVWNFQQNIWLQHLQKSKTPDKNTLKNTAYKILYFPNYSCVESK